MISWEFEIAGSTGLFCPRLEDIFLRSFYFFQEQRKNNASSFKKKKHQKYSVGKTSEWKCSANYARQKWMREKLNFLPKDTPLRQALVRKGSRFRALNSLIVRLLTSPPTAQAATILASLHLAYDMLATSLQSTPWSKSLSVKSPSHSCGSKWWTKPSFPFCTKGSNWKTIKY